MYNKQNSGRLLLPRQTGPGSSSGGSSHSHQKRFQMKRQQQMYQPTGSDSEYSGSIVSPNGSVLSGIPATNAIQLQTLKGAGSTQPRSRASSETGSDAFQFKQAPRTSTGYFSQGGVSARANSAYPSDRYPSTIRSGASGVSLSRSLGASKASLASLKGGKTSIQQEHHDRKVQATIRHPCSGEGRIPFFLAIVFTIIFLISIFFGILIIVLRDIGTVFLTTNAGEITGPILIAGSFIFFAIAVKFAHTAYKIRNKEMNKIKYQAATDSMVNPNITSSKYKPGPREALKSGTFTPHALSRTPLGSHSSLHNLA